MVKTRSGRVGRVEEGDDVESVRVAFGEMSATGEGQARGSRGGGGGGLGGALDAFEEGREYDESQYEGGEEGEYEGEEEGDAGPTPFGGGEVVRVGGEGPPESARYEGDAESLASGRGRVTRGRGAPGGRGAVENDLEEEGEWGEDGEGYDEDGEGYDEDGQGYDEDGQGYDEVSGATELLVIAAEERRGSVSTSSGSARRPPVPTSAVRFRGDPVRAYGVSPVQQGPRAGVRGASGRLYPGTRPKTAGVPPERRALPLGFGKSGPPRETVFDEAGGGARPATAGGRPRAMSEHLMRLSEPRTRTAKFQKSRPEEPGPYVKKPVYGLPWNRRPVSSRVTEKDIERLYRGRGPGGRGGWVPRPKWKPADGNDGEGEADENRPPPRGEPRPLSARLLEMSKPRGEQHRKGEADLSYQPEKLFARETVVPKLQNVPGHGRVRELPENSHLLTKTKALVEHINQTAEGKVKVAAVAPRREVVPLGEGSHLLKRTKAYDAAVSARGEKDRAAKEAAAKEERMRRVAVLNPKSHLVTSTQAARERERETKLSARAAVEKDGKAGEAWGAWPLRGGELPAPPPVVPPGGEAGDGKTHRKTEEEIAKAVERLSVPKRVDHAEEGPHMGHANDVAGLPVRPTWNSPQGAGAAYVPPPREEVTRSPQKPAVLTARQMELAQPRPKVPPRDHSALQGEGEGSPVPKLRLGQGGMYDRGEYLAAGEHGKDELLEHLLEGQDALLRSPRLLVTVGHGGGGKDGVEHEGAVSLSPKRSPRSPRSPHGEAMQSWQSPPVTPRGQDAGHSPGKRAALSPTKSPRRAAASPRRAAASPRKDAASPRRAAASPRGDPESLRMDPASNAPTQAHRAAQGGKAHHDGHGADFGVDVELDSPGDVEPPWQSPVVTPDKQRAAAPNLGLMDVNVSGVHADERSPSRSPVPALDLTRVGAAPVGQRKKPGPHKGPAYPAAGGQRTIVTRNQALAQLERERARREGSPTVKLATSPAAKPKEQAAVVQRRSARGGTVRPPARSPAKSPARPPARPPAKSPADSTPAKSPASKHLPLRRPSPASPEERAASLLDESEESDWVPHRRGSSAVPTRGPPKVKDPVEDLLEDLDASDGDFARSPAARESVTKKSPKDRAAELLSDLEASSEGDSGGARKRRSYSSASPSPQRHSSKEISSPAASQVRSPLTPAAGRSPPSQRATTPRRTPRERATELFEELDASDYSSEGPHGEAMSTGGRSDRSALDLVLA